MLTPVFFLITANNANTKVECGNERVEGTVKIPAWKTGADTP